MGQIENLESKEDFYGFTFLLSSFFLSGGMPFQSKK